MASPKDSLFGQRAGQARALARLSYVSPFIPERIALEKEVLGHGYVAMEREWNVDASSFGTSNPNIRGVEAVAGELVGLAREGFLAGRERRRSVPRTPAWFTSRCTTGTSNSSTR
jgi:hypothetical protein